MHQTETTSTDTELAAEQSYIDRAYACLERTRKLASQMREGAKIEGAGGTFQARYESDVVHENVANRLAQLDIGDQSLCFGRIDQRRPTFDTRGTQVSAADADLVDRFYIGRLAVSDETQEPVVVDWRAPVAEAFYRATGGQPMGLVRRRHFATRGRVLLGLDDELFGDAVAGLDHGRIQGQGALISALES